MPSTEGFLFPHNFSVLSDLDAALAIFAGYCHSEAGKIKMCDPRFYTNAEEIIQQHIPVNEALLLLRNGKILPVIDHDDESVELSNLKTQGWIIDVEHLFSLLKMLDVFNTLTKFIEACESVVELKKRIVQVPYHSHLLPAISKIIDEKGKIRDSASEELHALRRSHVSKLKEIDKRLSGIFKQLKSAGMIDDEAGMTIRNGRTVFPVQAMNKYKVKGIIHDESATGQTAYIEPLEIVELGNQLRENIAAQQREIRRILTVISELLSIHIEDILHYYEILVETDVIFAKADFVWKNNAVLPQPFNKPLIDWKQARHLVLQKHLEKQGKTIVPLHIKLDSSNRLIVLSGANAGGKSVVLKSVALIQALIQCGLPVPMHESSSTGVFSAIFLDIGDGQSIEANLSTYSSHLQTMQSLITKLPSDGLYLIDEIGTGTDPVLGGALAQAILLHLHNKGSLGIVTTHLDMLKQMADTAEGIQNAAMVFDTEKLEPSFELRSGVPGNSFTFEIAGRSGIPVEIIDQAKLFAGDERIAFERKISDVQHKESLLLAGIEKQKMAEEFLSEMIEKYTSLIDRFETEKMKIINLAQSEANEILSKANRVIEEAVREIKQSEADKEITRQAREKVEKVKKEVEKFEPATDFSAKVKRHSKEIKASKQKTINSLPVVWKKGMQVLHKDTGKQGEVLDVLKSGQLKIGFRSIVVTMKSDILIPLSEEKQNVKQNSVKYATNMTQKSVEFNRNLDLRGNRAEDVMQLLEKHIDDALLVGIYDFSILHGKGFGVLRTVVRQILAKHPNVQSFESEHVERGGDGITLVTLKR